MNENELVQLQLTLYESRNATRRWLHNTRHDWISGAIRKQRRCRRALEIGPGSGIYIPVLKEICEEVHVTDCEIAYLSAIKERYANDTGVKISADDITKSKLPADYYDLVLCTEVLEHVTDSRPALLHISRILKPDGILILSTPQRYSLLELTAKLALSPALIWLTRFAYREPVLEMGHINLMTEATMQSQIEAAKLGIIERHKSGLYLPGIAELCGASGQRLAALLESRLRGSWLECILWTQYYIATRHDGRVARADLRTEHKCHRYLKNPAVVQFIRYLAVGLSAAGIYFVSTQILHQYAQVPLAVAATISFAGVVSLNYIMHRSWTFKSNRTHITTIPRFVATTVGAMAINGAVVTFGTSCLPLHQTPLLLIGIGLVVLWNYVLARRWVFQPRPSTMMRPD